MYIYGSGQPYIWLTLQDKPCPALIGECLAERALLSIFIATSAIVNLQCYERYCQSSSSSSPLLSARCVSASMEHNSPAVFIVCPAVFVVHPAVCCVPCSVYCVPYCVCCVPCSVYCVPSNKRALFPVWYHSWHFQCRLFNEKCTCKPKSVVLARTILFVQCMYCIFGREVTQLRSYTTYIYGSGQPCSSDMHSAMV